MARWDDLRRAIDARDTEGTERIWLELLESDLDSIDRFLAISRRPGASRAASARPGSCCGCWSSR